MDFNAFIAELRTSSEHLPQDSADRSLLSSVYCNKACKVLDEVAEATDYDNVITGLWLVTAHFAEQLAYLKPVPALSELCFKLFRQCAKAVLNIQWQNLDEDSSLRQNFLASLANLHSKLMPFDFPRFCLLEALTENPWTNPTLAKVMGGEVEDGDKEEVRHYIEQEDPIILQLRVDMMLQENCEEYALNLCNNCLSHPELQSDLGVRKTQLSLLYKLGQEDRLQEECQKLSIQDAVRIIKQLQTSETHRQICTVLAQTFMVQNWIRPSDMDANKELLRLWIRHQLLVDREQDQFKESVWAMAKLSQSTEQIVIFIDVLREECGEIFLQLYVDMCIFAINVDKGQMETNKKEGNMEAAAARRSDMASICAKLSCLCHHASIKVARVCALTSFALKPTDQSFAKIGTFYGQGTDCCHKCGRDRNREPGTINPATLYEVERLLNMLRPDYLSPDQSYTNIQILCRRFLQESLKSAQELQRQQLVAQNLGSTSLTDGSVNKVTAVSSRPTNVFEALSPQDYQNTQLLLNRMRIQCITHTKPPMTSPHAAQHHFKPGGTSLLQHGILGNPSRTNKAQYMFDVEKIKSKQPYGVPVEQQHQYYLMKHEKELEQRRKNAQKKREEKTQQSMTLNSQVQQQRLWPQQQNQQHSKQQHNDPVQHIIQTALQDSNTLQKLTQSANPGIVQAVINIMKGSAVKPVTSSESPQQQLGSPQMKPMASAPQQGTALPTVSTLLKPTVQTHKHQQQPQSLDTPREQSVPRRYPRPQLYAQPISVSAASSIAPQKYQPSVISAVKRDQVPVVSSPISPKEKQKAEGFVLAKSHVEDIRRFMQMQMSNLQQKQIAEPRQMSGSTVTMKDTPLTSVSSLSFTNQSRTTVQLAHQAALAKLQKQESGKPSMSEHSQQLNSNSGQIFMSQQPQHKPSHLQQQQHFTPSSNRTESVALTPPPPHISLQHQHKLLQSQQHQVNTFSFQNSPSSNVVASAVLPSDELSGSIMGIDDTIIKELLQDSGILANTFPDIEVETIGEDKCKLTSAPLPATPPISSHMSKSSHSQLYSYVNTSTSQAAYTADTSPASRQPAQSGPIITGSSRQPGKTTNASHLPGSLQQPSVAGIARYSSPGATCQSGGLNTSLLSSISTLADGAASGQPTWADTKCGLSAHTKDNTSFLSNKRDIREEQKPTVDQLREIMKKEDIEGEVCMDAANNATYRCIICSIAFESLDHLREHVRNVCKPGLQSSSVYNTKIKQDRANSAKAGVETTTVFQCLRCFELCVSDAGIKQHRLTCKRVPTVPSDLKKDIVNSKQKVLSKTASTKQPHRKVLKDYSEVVPDLPLPFPYPSLNAEAVLKSMSLAGSLISQTPLSEAAVSSSSSNSSSSSSSKSASQVATGHVFYKAGTDVWTSAPSTVCSTSSPVSTAALSVGASMVSTCLTVTCQQSPSSSHTVSLVNQTPICSTAITAASACLVDTSAAEELAVTDTSIPQEIVDAKNVKHIPREDSETILRPSFTEITGSGGSQFYKCGLCSQTLCSHESFLVHWKECAVKNKNLIRKLELKEKACNSTPITGEVLENLMGVICEVASGGGSIPEAISLDSDDVSVDIGDYCCLRDPCRPDFPDLGDLSDYSQSSWWHESSDSSGPDDMSEGATANTTDTGDGSATECGFTDHVDVSKDVENVCEKDADEEIQEEDDDEDDDDDDSVSRHVKRKHAEVSDSEDVSEGRSKRSFVSTRKAPPKLRDRKTLKPIQSFINEAFNSPFSKTALKPFNARSGEKLKEDEEGNRERQTSECEAETDGQSLYCQICKTSFQTKRILLQHFAGKHLQPYTVKTVADSCSYFCHLCQKTFSTFMHYMQHVPNHSVTICEKMTAFIASRQSQRSQRIAQQRGLAKKGNMSPKMAKALKSKKAATKSAVDRLKQQLLAGKTQAVRERLRISKRKRSMQPASTSSEDDYSSDASNNVVFQSKKSAESENWVPTATTTRPRRSTTQLHQTKDVSSPRSWLEPSEEEESDDQGPRLARDHDDDYVLSEDFDSDSTDSIAPPTTRSSRRIALSLGLSDSQVSSSHDLKAGSDDPSDNRPRHSQSSVFAAQVVDNDADSNSSVLILSQCENGTFVPSETRAGMQGRSYEGASDAGDISTAQSGQELITSRILCVRALSRQQKETLKTCNLQPKVVLETMRKGKPIPCGLKFGFSGDTLSQATLVCSSQGQPTQLTSLQLEPSLSSPHEPSFSSPHEPSFPSPQHEPSFPQHEPSFPSPQHESSFPSPQHESSFPQHEPFFPSPQHESSSPQHEPFFPSPQHESSSPQHEPFFPSPQHESSSPQHEPFFPSPQHEPFFPSPQHEPSFPSPQHEPSASASIRTTSSSFLDSFLSYLNQYPSHATASSPAPTGGRQRCKSGPPPVRGLRKRRTSIDISHTATADLSLPVSGHEQQQQQESIPPSSNQPKSDMSSTIIHVHSKSLGEEVQNILSKFPTRPCSVNLGHKLSLQELQTHCDFLSGTREIPPDKPPVSTVALKSHKGSTQVTDSASSSSSAVSDGKRVAGSCVDQSGKVNGHAARSSDRCSVMLTSESSLRKHCPASSLRDAAVASAKGHSQNRRLLASTDKMSGGLSLPTPSTAQPSSLTSQFFTSTCHKQQIRSGGSKKPQTKIDRLENNHKPCTFQSRFEETALRHVQYSGPLKANITSAVSGSSYVKSSDFSYLDSRFSDITYSTTESLCTESSDIKSSTEETSNNESSDMKCSTEKTSNTESSDIKSSSEETSNTDSSNIKSTEKTSNTESSDIKSSTEKTSNTESSDIKSSTEKTSNTESSDIKSSTVNTSNTDSSDIKSTEKTSNTESSDIKSSTEKTSNTESFEIKSSTEKNSNTESSYIKSSTENTSNTESSDIKSSTEKTSNTESSDIKSTTIESSNIESSDIKSPDIKPDIRFSDLGSSDCRPSCKRSSEPESVDTMSSPDSASINSVSIDIGCENRESSGQECSSNHDLVTQKQSAVTSPSQIGVNMSTVSNISGDPSVDMSDCSTNGFSDKVLPCDIDEHSACAFSNEDIEGHTAVAVVGVGCSLAMSETSEESHKLNTVRETVEADSAEDIGSINVALESHAAGICETDGPCVVTETDFAACSQKILRTHLTPSVEIRKGPGASPFVDRPETPAGAMSVQEGSQCLDNLIVVSAEMGGDLSGQPHLGCHEGQSFSGDALDDKLETNLTSEGDPSHCQSTQTEVMPETRVEHEAAPARDLRDVVASQEVTGSLQTQLEEKEHSEATDWSSCHTCTSDGNYVRNGTQYTGDACVVVNSSCKKVVTCDTVGAGVADQNSNVGQVDMGGACLIPTVESSASMQSSPAERTSSASGGQCQYVKVGDSDSEMMITYTKGSIGGEAVVSQGEAPAACWLSYVTPAQVGSSTTEDPGTSLSVTSDLCVNVGKSSLDVSDSDLVNDDMSHVEHMADIASLTPTVVDSDMKTAPQVGSNNVEVVSACPDPGQNRVDECVVGGDFCTPDTSLVAGSSLDPSSENMSVAGPACDTSVQGVALPLTSCGEPIEANSNKHRKQKRHTRAIFNPSISLAAFIAERLSKEDLEPTAAYSRRSTNRASVREIGEDSPLDIGCHMVVATEITPRENYGNNSILRLDAGEVDPVSSDTSVDCSPSANTGQLGLEPVSFTPVGHAASSVGYHNKKPACHSPGQEKLRPVTGTMNADGSSSTNIFAPSRKESMKLAYMSPRAAIPHAGGNSQQSGKPVGDQPLDKCHRLKETDHAQPSSVFSSSLVDYSSSDDEEEAMSTHEHQLAVDSCLNSTQKSDMDNDLCTHEDSVKEPDKGSDFPADQDSVIRRFSVTDSTCDPAEVLLQTDNLHGRLNAIGQDRGKELGLDKLSPSARQSRNCGLLVDVLEHDPLVSDAQVAGAGIDESHSHNDGCCPVSGECTESVQEDFKQVYSKILGSVGADVADSSGGLCGSPTTSQHVTLFKNPESSNSGTHLCGSTENLLCDKNLFGSQINERQNISLSSDAETSSQIINLCENIENSSQDINLCENIENSSQDINLCENIENSSQDINFCENTENSSQDISLCENIENSSQDINLCENTENSSQDISLCENTENSSQDINLCENTENSSQDIKLCASTETSSKDFNPCAGTETSNQDVQLYTSSSGYRNICPIESLENISHQAPGGQLKDTNISPVIGSSEEWTFIQDDIEKRCHSDNIDAGVGHTAAPVPYECDDSVVLCAVSQPVDPQQSISTSSNMCQGSCPQLSPCGSTAAGGGDSGNGGDDSGGGGGGNDDVRGSSGGGDSDFPSYCGCDESEMIAEQQEQSYNSGDQTGAVEVPWKNFSLSCRLQPNICHSSHGAGDDIQPETSHVTCVENIGREVCSGLQQEVKEHLVEEADAVCERTHCELSTTNVERDTAHLRAGTATTGQEMVQVRTETAMTGQEMVQVRTETAMTRQEMAPGRAETAVTRQGHGQTGAGSVVSPNMLPDISRLLPEHSPAVHDDMASSGCDTELQAVGQGNPEEHERSVVDKSFDAKGLDISSCQHEGDEVLLSAVCVQRETVNDSVCTVHVDIATSVTASDCEATGCAGAADGGCEYVTPAGVQVSTLTPANIDDAYTQAPGTTCKPFVQDNSCHGSRPVGSWKPLSLAGAVMPSDDITDAQMFLDTTGSLQLKHGEITHYPQTSQLATPALEVSNQDCQQPAHDLPATVADCEIFSDASWSSVPESQINTDVEPQVSDSVGNTCVNNLAGVDSKGELCTGNKEDVESTSPTEAVNQVMEYELGDRKVKTHAEIYEPTRGLVGKEHHQVGKWSEKTHVEQSGRPKSDIYGSDSNRFGVVSRSGITSPQTEGQHLYIAFETVQLENRTWKHDAEITSVDCSNVSADISSERTSVDRPSSERTSVDRPSSQRTSVDRPSSQRTSVDRTTLSADINSERTRVDGTAVSADISSERTSVDRHSSERTSVDSTAISADNSIQRTSVDRHNSERTSVDIPSSERTNVDSTAISADNSSQRTSVDRHNSERRSVDRSSSEITNTDRPGIEQTSVYRPDSEKSVDRTDSERTSVDDDSDDLSDFDLIIEKDTSCRNLLSFPVSSEKKTYSPTLPHSTSLYISRGKVTYLPSNMTSVLSGVFNNTNMSTAEGHQSLQGHQLGVAARKPLVCAKTCRRSHGQFVWEVEDDHGGGKTAAAAAALTSSVARNTSMSASRSAAEPGVDSLRRKQKALREKSETAPFTWDLDDNTDSLAGLVRVRCPVKVDRDVISFGKVHHGVNTAPAKSQVHRRMVADKRPLTPDVPAGKMPAKFRRTFSVDRQVKPSGSPVRKELKASGVLVANDGGGGEVSNANPVTNPTQRFMSESICVDEDISFKRESFSPSAGFTMSLDTQTSLTDGDSCGHEVRGKRTERTHKTSHFPLPPVVVLHDWRSESCSQTAGEGVVKNHSGLRSYRSSVESNRSDKLVSTKRPAEGNSHLCHKKSRKGDEDLSSPKLKKIGLIKISKDSRSPPSTGLDSMAPMTRSSEAAILAFHQKSLRSRGVNPCLPAPMSSSSPKLALERTLPKGHLEASLRLKSCVPLQKTTPTLRYPSVDAKLAVSSKTSARKLHEDSEFSMGAVVKRRSAPAPVSPQGVRLARASATALRSRKHDTEYRKHGHVTAGVSVDSPHNVAASRGMSCLKETKTAQRPVTANTSSIRSKKDSVRQHQKWPVMKDTKLSKGKKQHR